MKFSRFISTLLFIFFFLMECAWADVYLHTPPINISWSPNPEPDVAGYEVFRSNAFDGTFTKAHTGFITSTQWRDYNVSEGGKYYYKLRAVDSSGNFSLLSAASDAVILDSIPPAVTPSAPGGTYSQSIAVSLVANEPATICYTINGSLPTTGSLIYSSPISISQSMTLRFFATDAASNQSLVRTEIYVIDSGTDELTLAAAPGGTPNPVSSGGEVRCQVQAKDSSGHSLSYQWTATGGVFSSPASSNPTWRAPKNWSLSSQFYEIKVSVACSGGKSVSGSYFQEVQPGVNVAPMANAGPDVFTSVNVPVALNGCASYDPDGGPSALSFQWKQIGGTAVSIDGANTCFASFVSPAIDGILQFELSISDGFTTAIDTVRITMDSQPPVILQESLGPYPNQGLDGKAGASALSCFRVKVLDNVGLRSSQQDLEQSIKASSVYLIGGKETFEPLKGEVIAIDAEAGATWLQFVPDNKTYGSGLPLGVKIAVTISPTDLAGNAMAPFSYQFMVEAYPPNLPLQIYSGDSNPSEPGDIVSVTLQEGQFAGARIEFLDAVPSIPYFVYLNELLKVKRTNCIPVCLQPPMVFQDPAKIFVPVKRATNLKKYRIFRYDPNPAIGWLEAQVGDGWLIFREDHIEYSTPTIELWINHF